MPLPEGTKYRWKTFPSGKKVRLAIKGGKVIETKTPKGQAQMTDDFKSHMKKKHGDKYMKLPK